MRSIILTTLLFFLLSSFLHSGIFPFQVHRKVLDNGFKVLVIPLPNPGLVAYYSVVRTGSRDEYEPGHTGFAHFFEHMMFRGTKRHPSNVYDKMVTEMGADSNAYTTDDLTAYHLVFAADDLEKVMDLESDRFQNLDYGEPAFKTESGAVKGEYLKSKSSPWFILYEAMLETAYDKHTYRHTTIGFAKDIDAMPTMYNFSKEFYNRYYRPENVVLLICGDVQPQPVFELVEKYYGKWEKGYVPPKVESEPEQKAPRSQQVNYRGKTLPLLSIGYKGLAFAPESKDYVASHILGDIMFGETSEIYNKLVLVEQKVQYLFFEFDLNRDPGLNVVTAMVKNEKDVDYVRQEIEKTVKKHQTEKMELDKLEKLKRNLKYSFLMRLSSTDRIAGSLPRIIAISGDISAIDTYYETLEMVNPEDIFQAAKNFFTNERKTEILVLGGGK